MKQKKEISILPKNQSMHILSIVSICHFLLFLFFCISKKNSIYQLSKPLVVHHFTEKIISKTKPVISQRRIIKKEPLKTKSLKEVVSKKNKKESITSSTLTLLNSLEEDLKKNQSNKDSKNLPVQDLPVPKEIKEIKSIVKIEESVFSIEKQRLIEELQYQLHLPEVGEIKCSFLIDKSGQIASLHFISSKSAKNLTYLKNTLPELSFPWFNQQQEKETHFLITFTNE